MRAPRLAVFALLALVPTVSVAVPAQADPSSLPPAQSIVAASDEALSPLCDQFSLDYNATSPIFPLYCWDAQGSNPIESKNNAVCESTRPGTSGAGIDAVSSSPEFEYGGQTYRCWDLAFVTRPLTASDPSGLEQDPFAEDLLTYSYLPSGNLPSNLTPLDLRAIYSCNASLINSSYNGPVTEAEIGGRGTHYVVPVLPLIGSAVSTQWLTDLGLGGVGVAPCVYNGDYTYNGTEYPIGENEGTNLVFNPADDPYASDVVFPYSGAAYVCFNDTKACAGASAGSQFNPGSLVLGDISDLAPLTGPPSDQRISITTFPPAFIYTQYVDFVGTGTEPYVPTYLRPLLGTDAKGSGWLCSRQAPATSEADIAKWGFATAANCGLVTPTP